MTAEKLNTIIENQSNARNDLVDDCMNALDTAEKFAGHEYGVCKSAQVAAQLLKRIAYANKALDTLMAHLVDLAA